MTRTPSETAERIEAENALLKAQIATMNSVSLHQTDRPVRRGHFGIQERFHPLTCGNDRDHTPLFPWCDDGKVKLICRDCDYTQDNAAMFGRSLASHPTTEG